MTDVAATIDDISPEWLSAVLGRTVTAVAAKRIGTGQMGETYRLSVDGPDGPSVVIAKLATGDDAARQRVSDGYRAEIGFYSHVAPTVDVRTPGCLHASITDDAMAFTLLMEDLAPREPGVQANGCSLVQAQQAVDNLAALHAPRWNDESLWELPFARRPSAEGAEFLGAIMGPAVEQFVERFPNDLGADDVETLRGSARAVAAWMQHELEPFSVLHGDYRLDNLLFAPDGSDVVAVDWQTCAVGPAERDLAYFLGNSVEVDDRRAWEHDLVARYHRELVARGVTDHSLEQCRAGYRAGQLQGPVIAVLGCVYAMGEQSRAADEMFLAMVRRSCAAIRDLETLSVF